jgi:hypothetical protein
MFICFFDTVVFICFFDVLGINLYKFFTIILGFVLELITGFLLVNFIKIFFLFIIFDKDLCGKLLFNGIVCFDVIVVELGVIIVTLLFTLLGYIFLLLINKFKKNKKLNKLNIENLEINYQLNLLKSQVQIQEQTFQNISK